MKIHIIFSPPSLSVSLCSPLKRSSLETVSIHHFIEIHHLNATMID